MAKTAARLGRKPIPAIQGQRRSLGLKVTPTIKNKIDMAAKKNGRTQSQEAEARIERTFCQDDAIEAALVIMSLISKPLDAVSESEFPSEANDHDEVDRQIVDRSS